MIILISLKKLPKASKRLIKKNYSLLEFKKSQINKSIAELGDAEVLLFELDASLIFNIQNNIIYKYLKTQDLTSVKVVFIYDKTKYKKLLNNVNHFIRKLPIFIGKTLIESIEEQEILDEETPSKFDGPPVETLDLDEESPKHETHKLSDDLVSPINPDEEIKRILECSRTILASMKCIEKLNNDYKTANDKLEKALVTIEKLEKEKEHIQNNQKELEKQLERPVLTRQSAVVETFSVESDSKKISILSNINGIVESIPYKNSIEKRKALKKLKSKYRI